MKNYECLTCAIRGIKKEATDMIPYQEMYITVCKDCLERLYPEKIMLRSVMKYCIDDLLRSEGLDILQTDQA